jgi:WD40 repeat protein
VDFDPGPGVHELERADFTDFILKLDAEGRFVWVQAQGLRSNGSIALGPDGSVYVVGNGSHRIEGQIDLARDAAPRADKLNAYVARYSAAGSRLWVRSLPGSESIRANSVAVDSAGSVYSTGVFEGSIEFNARPGASPLHSAGATDIFVLKLDRDGNFVWARSMGGPSHDRGSSLTVDEAGFVYLTGHFSDSANFDPGVADTKLTSAGDVDSFVARISPEGQLDWVRQLGGAGEDCGLDVAVDRIGNVYATGYFSARADFDPSPTGWFELLSAGVYDAYICKLDKSGHILWAQRLGGKGPDSGSGIAVDGAGHIYLAGTFEKNAAFDLGNGKRTEVRAPATDIFLYKTSGPDAPVWAVYERPHGGIGGVAFSPDGRHVAVGSDGELSLWRPRRLEDKRAAMSHAPEEAWSVAFSRDGRLLVSGGDNEIDKNCLRVWERKTGRLLWTGRSHEELVTCVACSPSGEIIASGSFDKTVKLWNERSGEVLATLPGHEAKVLCLAFSPDGRILATGGRDGRICLWDVGSRQHLRSLSGGPEHIRAIVFSLDGRRLITSSDPMVRFWDVTTGNLEQSFNEGQAVYSLALSPDGRTLALGSREDSRDGGRVQLWDLSTGQKRVLAAENQREVRALAFTPDGRRLASAGVGQIIRLWDPVTGYQLMTLTGQRAAINGIAFAPDGKTLASAAHDGVIQLWQAAADEE